MRGPAQAKQKAIFLRWCHMYPPKQVVNYWPCTVWPASVIFFTKVNPVIPVKIDVVQELLRREELKAREELPLYIPPIVLHHAVPNVYPMCTQCLPNVIKWYYISILQMNVICIYIHIYANSIDSSWSAAILLNPIELLDLVNVLKAFSSLVWPGASETTRRNSHATKAHFGGRIWLTSCRQVVVCFARVP